MGSSPMRAISSIAVPRCWSNATWGRTNTIISPTAKIARNFFWFFWMNLYMNGGSAFRVVHRLLHAGGSGGGFLGLGGFLEVVLHGPVGRQRVGEKLGL